VGGLNQALHLTGGGNALPDRAADRCLLFSPGWVWRIKSI